MVRFEGNPLSPISIGFLPLAPDDANDLNLNIASEPPSSFRRTLLSPGLDRRVSGRILVTWALSHPLPSPVRAAEDSLSLRLPMLTLPRKYTPRRVFQNGRCNLESPLVTPLTECSFKELYQATSTYNFVVSGSFHLLLRILFSFPSPY